MKKKPQNLQETSYDTRDVKEKEKKTGSWRKSVVSLWTRCSFYYYKGLQSALIYSAAVSFYIYQNKLQSDHNLTLKRYILINITK